MYMQIVDSITDAIRRGNYKMGDRIYSINELSNEYFLARDTVQKAYNILHERGVITSVKGKGYYVNNTNLDIAYKVLLLFSKISNYKKQIYNSFVHTLGNNAVVDIKIHHFNAALFREHIQTNINNYDYFVVMPHFYDDPAEALSIIKTIPQDKLIILDKNIPATDLHSAAVYQDFQNDIVHALEQGLDLLKKYDKLYLVFPGTGKYSPEIVQGFRKFCMQNDFRNEVLEEITPGTEIGRGETYIVIEESDLCNLIKLSREKKLQIGKDLGIISYNDSPLKEILLDGITVITTDHIKMGETAARLILDNSKEKIKNPFVLIRRGSV
ncbi:MAG: GntR family transcriptional regulator [Chitinophagaceae bacterium]|nr:GntR family transcriptional regulator [Chitinophagaceae bacterium]